MNDFVPDFSEYLNKLIEYIKKLLGVNVCVFVYSDVLRERYLLKFDPVTEYCHSCKYCRMMQDIEGRRLCTDFETKNDFEAAMQYKKPFVRRCFAGVNEALIPLFSAGELGAIIKIGQCREKDYTTPGVICELFSKNKDMLSKIDEEYLKLPVVDKEVLLETANIVDYAFKVFAWDNFVLDDEFPEYNVTAEKAKELIDEYIIKADFNISHIAEKLNITTEHLCRMFVKKYKISILEYLTRMRIKRAKFLLINTGFSIQKISEKCGFTDSSYFSRVFKKKVGITPGEYRNGAEKV